MRDVSPQLNQRVQALVFDGATATALPTFPFIVAGRGLLLIYLTYAHPPAAATPLRLVSQLLPHPPPAPNNSTVAHKAQGVKVCDQLVVSAC